MNSQNTAISDKRASGMNSSNRYAAIKTLFRNTVAPSDRDTVKQFLLDSETQLKDYQSEINRLKVAIMTLEDKRSGLKKTIETCRSLLSPIHGMPAEILTNIFTFCCEENKLDVTTSAPVITLSNVSGRWRDIVLTAPLLWSVISIRFGKWHKDHLKLNSITKLFVERSKSSFLEMDLNLAGVELLDIEPLKPSLDLLIKNSGRWSRLSLQIPQSLLQLPIFRPLQGNLPHLKHLKFVPSSPSHIFNPFHPCPALLSLDCDPEYLSGFVFAWKQIRSLKLFTSYAASAMEVLSFCSNVEHLELENVGGGDREAAHVMSPNLTDLSVRANYQIDASCVFVSCTLPRLTSLRVSGLSNNMSKEWNTWDDVPITDFFRRSSCVLTTLHLQWVPISEKQVISLLELLPSLKVLHIEEYKHKEPGIAGNRVVSLEFLRRLRVVHECSSLTLSPHFLPLLTHITLVIHVDGLDPNALLTTLSSRWLSDSKYASEIGVECLRSVSITTMGKESPEETFSSLSYFRDAGMQLTLTHLII